MTTSGQPSAGQHTPGPPEAMCVCFMERGDDGAVHLVHCPTHAAAPEMLASLRDLAEMHDGRCDSCNARPAEEGYCGCAPLRDAVMNERRCAARALLAKIEGRA